MKNYDLVIVGAGIIGLSIALQVARRSSLRVLVLERAPGVGEGSTGASSAVCRHRYSRKEMVDFARDGISAYRNWSAFTGLEQPRAEFQQHGVLWMPGSDSAWAEREHKRMRALGIATAVLDDRELQARFPAMSTCRLQVDCETGEGHVCAGGGRHLLELEGGYIDPVAAAEDLVEACRAKSVEIRFGSQVSDILTQGGAVSGVQLENGEAITCPRVINAAGPWCNALNEKIGLALPWNLVPTRIQILYIDRPPELVGDIPACADMENGIYFRLQNRGQQLVVGSVLESDERESVENPDEFDRFADEDFKLSKLHALHHRLPALPYRGARRGYCGLYTMNRDDVHPLIGESTVPGFFVANGFSGHGFKLAPAVGAMLAKLITGSPSTFDTQVAPEFFAIDREPIDPDSKSVLA